MFSPRHISSIAFSVAVFSTQRIVLRMFNAVLQRVINGMVSYNCHIVGCSKEKLLKLFIFMTIKKFITFDEIFVCQTLNHLLGVRKSSKLLRAKTGGFLSLI